MKIPEGWKLVPVEPTQEILEAIDSVADRPAAGYYVRLYDAIYESAPTPPAQTIPLETLVAEMEADPEMKAALDEARKTDMLKGATVVDIAPTQEDEPVAEREVMRCHCLLVTTKNPPKRVSLKCL